MLFFELYFLDNDCHSRDRLRTVRFSCNNTSGKSCICCGQSNNLVRNRRRYTIYYKFNLALTKVYRSIASATAQVMKPQLINENDEPIESGPDEDLENFWHTSLGKFKFAIADLPEQLQYIYELLMVYIKFSYLRKSFLIIYFVLGNSKIGKARYSILHVTMFKNVVSTWRCLYQGLQRTARIFYLVPRKFINKKVTETLIVVRARK